MCPGGSKDTKLVLVLPRILDLMLATRQATPADISQPPSPFSISILAAELAIGDDIDVGLDLGYRKGERQIKGGARTHLLSCRHSCSQLRVVPLFPRQTNAPA